MKIDRKRSCAHNTAQIIATQSEWMQSSKRELSSSKFRCATCNKNFSSRGNLKTHERIHRGEKPYSCDQCNKSFSFPGNLTVHKRIHANIKPYKCEECGKNFSAKGNLLAHVRTHTGSKPFKCEECSKRFSHKGNLNAHMRIHLGLKPFICSYCKKGFAHKGNLNVHLKVHGKPVTYSCEICPKVFSKQRLLKKHQYKHSNPSKANDALQQLQADENTSKDAGTADSNTHKILSNNDISETEKRKKIQDLQLDRMRFQWRLKPFTCPECSKGFTHKNSLAIHMRVHGRPVTYSCEICPKVFSKQRLLKKHLDQHSNPAKANDALRELLAGENISMEPGSMEMANNSGSAKLEDSNIHNLILLNDSIEGRDGKDKVFGCVQECVVCSQKFVDEQKLEIHLRSHLPSSNNNSK